MANHVPVSSPELHDFYVDYLLHAMDPDTETPYSIQANGLCFALSVFELQRGQVSATKADLRGLPAFSYVGGLHSEMQKQFMAARLHPIFPFKGKGPTGYRLGWCINRIDHYHRIYGSPRNIIVGKP